MQMIITENEDNMQLVQDYIAVWCRRWRMKVNTKKTKVMHVRGKPCKSTQAIFNLDGTELELVSKYKHDKYLGLFFNEHMDMREFFI